MQMTFTNEDGEDFSALRDAERWCRERNHATGPMQRSAPIGVHHAEDDEEVSLSKWSGMSRREQRSLDGRIEPVIGHDYKHGPVRLYLTGGPLA